MPADMVVELGPEFAKYSDRSQARQRFWCDIYVAAVRSGDPGDVAAVTAQRALDRFDSAFPDPEKLK